MLCYPQNNGVYKYRQDSFLWAVAGQHETSRGQSEREAEKLPSGPIQGVVSNALGPAITEKVTGRLSPRLPSRCAGLWAPAAYSTAPQVCGMLSMVGKALQTTVSRKYTV